MCYNIVFRNIVLWDIVYEMVLWDIMLRNSVAKYSLWDSVLWDVIHCSDAACVVALFARYSLPMLTMLQSKYS